MADSDLRRLGQYEIIRPLGRGGMGEVYLARDLRLGRLVAVKLLTSRSPDLDERLLAEARATARCRHDNIVVVYEVATHLGRPYMVLEYVEGQTLRDWMDDHAAPVSPARAVELMLPVVRALAYAHGQDIVHRDLKPENVMLTRVGGVKVLDFGVAMQLAEHVDGAGAARNASSLAGTRPYMAPEQLSLGTIDHRVDLWAAGIMLFELVAGEHPVTEASPRPVASERLPDIGPLAAVIDRCLIEDATRRTASALSLLAELEALTSARATVASETPFAGLAAFQEADAGRFFGRERDIAHVIAELHSRPLVAVFGPSGAGKSSLIRAGVIPALKRADASWDAYIVRPGRDPLASLAALFEDLAGVQFRTEPGTLGARLRARAALNQRRIVLFVDQLEELFTLGTSAVDRIAFLSCLAAVADDAASPLRVLVSMRSDFLDRLAENRQLGAELTRALVLLSPMDRESMRDALIRPVQALGHRFESATLVDRMVAAVAVTPGALPLLQFTAARLWESRDHERHLLTETSYDELGGVEGALASHADAVVAGMSAAQQTLTRVVMMRLVTPERTRAIVSLSELHALSAGPALVDDTIQHLIAMRLVVAERGAEEASPSVELVHESLIERWPTLVRWLDEDHEDAAMHTRVRAAAKEWARADQAPGLLWTGEAAREARVWEARYRGQLAPPEQRYIAAAFAASDRTRRRRRRLIGAIVTASLLAAVVMTWLALTQTEARRVADAEAMHARDAARLAALRTLSLDPTMQLAVLRELEDPAAATPEVLGEARRLVHDHIARVVGVVDDGLYSIAFSPDGRRIVTGGTTMVQVRDADGSGEPLTLRGHTQAIVSVGFSPDGRRIVSGSQDQTIRIWNADGTGVPLVLRQDAPVSSVAYSPEGRFILSATQDGAVRIWTADGKTVAVTLHHDAPANCAAWSPDGRHVVTASDDRALRIWSADGQGAPRVLRGHDGIVTWVAYSADGTRIVSTSDDRTVRVWRVDGSGEPVVLRGHTDDVQVAAFSPDGARIVSASNDHTARIWMADGSGEPVVLQGHDGQVYGAAFSPDGRRAVSVAVDRAIRWWSTDERPDPVVLLGHDGAVTSVAFSHDGERVASSSRDRTVRIWGVDGHGQPIVLRGHAAAVLAVAISPDDQRVASASADLTVRIWPIDGTGAPVILTGHAAPVTTVAFSPDGRSVVSGSQDHTVRVWRANGEGGPVVLRGHTDAIRSAAFTRDGRFIWSSAYDLTVRLWSSDGRSVGRIPGEIQHLQSAELSPDGRKIVTASDDGHVRIWNADGTGKPLDHQSSCMALWARFRPDGAAIVAGCRDGSIRIFPAVGEADPVLLLGHTLPVEHVQYSPDGQRLASASQDGTVRVWRDLAAISLRDPRFWSITSFCMTARARRKLWGGTEEQAERERRRCLARVASAAR